ncbi:hypothetical protein BDV98DRAFT_588152 [Pterulicium gracile]|uniref:Uncharacterized protein n=1 Tax=Pterulicium gracile TaxID=1884261 RepID=A0A5C3R0H9_9AGAR|nr:hypothetical protein BDV98DRAFT_588152 [Pterula gracilis]
MARSKTSTFSPTIVKQTVADEARSAGYGARDARRKGHAHVATLKANKADAAGLARRNPGRMDGVQWRGVSFTCPNQVDGDDNSSDYEEDGFDIVEVVEPRAAFTISLMDMATQSRPRGIAKQFEMVEGLPKVIVLDEDDFEQWADENEWEDLAKGETLEEPLKVSEDASRQKKSYSAALTNVDG